MAYLNQQKFPFVIQVLVLGHDDGALRFQKQVLWRCLSFLVNNIFVVFTGKVFMQRAESWHFNWYELRPSSHRHLSVFMRSGIHTVFALNGKEAVRISVQSHLQVYRWCIVHKQPRIWKLSGPDASCWTWDQGHFRELSPPLLIYIYFCRLGEMVNFTLPFTTNKMISISTSQTFRSWVVIFHLCRAFGRLVYAPIFETSFAELAVSFLDFSPWIPLGTFSILL